MLYYYIIFSLIIVIIIASALLFFRMYRKRHAKELSDLHEKFQDVLESKDKEIEQQRETIESLRIPFDEWNQERQRKDKEWQRLLDQKSAEAKEYYRKYKKLRNNNKQR